MSAPKRVGWLMSMLLAGTMAAVPASAATVQVALDVTVQKPDGTPVVEAPIEASTPHVNRFAMTGSNGEIHFTLDVDDTDSQIVVRLWTGEGFDLGLAESIHAEDRYRALLHTYAFPSADVVTIEAGTTSYALPVIAEEAITISGSVVDGGGEPRVGSLLLRDWRADCFIPASAQGHFELGGVPRGENVEILFGALGNRVHVLPLSAVQTTQNLDVGAITIVEPQGDSTADIEMTNRTDLYGYADAYLGGTLTLIRNDAQVIQFFRVNALDKAASPDLSSPLGGPTMLPAGTYYISPGTIGKALPLALFDAIRDGRQAALDAAGVPKITAVAGQTTALSFDARAARDAILSVAGDLMPQD